VTAPVFLDQLIDALEAQSESHTAYLDRETGEIHLISEDAISLSEGEADSFHLIAAWQEDEVELARRIQRSDRYLALPDQWEVNEWDIMADFSKQIKKDDVRAGLLKAIHGSHAFRRFKDQIVHFGVRDDWFVFRRQAFEEILRAWCEENGIAIKASQATARR
jgi:Uncharacterised protein family (UPF0158)